ncbi:efflux RND transporter periplasmic adaptor subunit [soil metagenome]
MTKRMFVMLIIVGVLFGGIFAYKAFQGYMIKRYFATQTAPVVVVAAKKIQYQVWQPKLKAVGSLRAVLGVDVTTEIAGLVRAIYFVPGSHVEKDTLLVDLNADNDIAHLHSLQANAKLAGITYRRDKAQYAIHAVSKAVLDTDVGNLQSLEAQVAEQAAIVAKKRIRAPFSGKLGISNIYPGQNLNPGNKIVTLQVLDPVYADFAIPQQQISRIALGQPITLSLEMYPRVIFSGKITTIDPKVDPSTRNVQVEATVANPKSLLLPGMFAPVTVTTGKEERLLTLPQAAISYNPYGDLVYLVNQTGKNKQGKPILTVSQVFVTTGEKRGDQVAILSGLKEGDTVVIAGQLKLKNGSEVTINNSIIPTNNPAPKTPDEY